MIAATGGAVQPSQEGAATERKMAKKTKADDRVSLSASLSKQTTFRKFKMILVGDTPLISHAWSEKAKREMLQKQVKATKPGKEIRDPESEFRQSLYQMDEGKFGFPVTGVKKCIMRAAHKDKGIAKTEVSAGLYLDAEMWRVRPALAGAVCDMPLVRIYGTDPEMREDMVKIGSGLNKTANFSYRGQFTIWAMRITGQFNSATITEEALAFLVNEAGRSCGIGEWRNERDGVFGCFHLADPAEESAWELHMNGRGPVPAPNVETLAAE